MDGTLHLTVPSMNRLNQTEPVTFSILPGWAFFRDSYSSLFYVLTTHNKGIWQEMKYLFYIHG
jgi:hypothetical protein